MAVPRKTDWICTPSPLFFILGHVFGEHVTVTDGDCRFYIYYNCEHSSDRPPHVITCDGVMTQDTPDYTTVYISYGKFNLRLVYLHELMSCLCPRNETAFLWRVAYHYGLWSIIDACCVFNLCPWVFIATQWMVTHWSSLEACLRSISWFKVQADLNTLIWSTEPVWNIFMIWYFWTFINLNNWCSNDTLVGV
jgi:hypothetical protein